MSSPANLHKGLSRALATNASVVLNPGTGNTLDLRGMNHATAVLSAGTYKLPNLPEEYVGTVLTVVATGTVILQNAAASTISTLANGETATLAAASTTTWTATVSGVTGTVASAVSIADAGAYTDQTSVEGAIQEIYSAVNVIDVPLTSFMLADGTPLGKFANDDNDPSPGFALVNSEALGIRFNNDATQDDLILASILIPAPVQNKALTAHVIASKTGATVGDATTFTFAAYVNAVSSLHDGGENLGGATSAMTGNATAKTVQHETLALTTLSEALAGPLPVTTFPCPMTFTLTPTSGTLGTDDVVIERVYFTY